MSDKSEATRIERAWQSLSKLNRSDLKLFSWSRLWTVPLLALHHGVHPSTANRRLHELHAMELLDVKPGHPWSCGGRTASTYRLTTIGEKLLMRLLLLDDVPHVAVPEVTGEPAVTRHLVALEVAIRGGVLTRTYMFHPITYTLRSGKQVAVLPALAFYDEVARRDVYVEVALADEFSRGVSKFEDCGRIFADYVARGHTAPLLIVVYPTRDVEEALQREHMAAAAQAIRSYPDARSAFASVNLDTLHERAVIRLNRVMGVDGRSKPVVVAAGLMQSLSHWFDGAVHHG